MVSASIFLLKHTVLGILNKAHQLPADRVAAKMSTYLLSQPEIKYIVSGVNSNFRADGRTCKDYRHFSIQTGVVSNTSGSSKIQLDRTAAIVGVKAELGTPLSTAPNCGRVEFFIDCSALASPEFENREGEELGQHLSQRLTEAYNNPSAIDLSQLVVIPGQQCWVLYVDALVLEWSGSVLDALSLAVWSALGTTLIPKLIVSGEGEEMEIEVSDNPHDSTRIDVTKAPLIITLTQVGHEFLVDASLEEEACSTVRLSLSVDRDGHVTSVNKEGGGGIPYHKMTDILSMGVEVAGQTFERIEKMLEQDLRHNDSNSMDTSKTGQTSVFR